MRTVLGFIVIVVGIGLFTGGVALVYIGTSKDRRVRLKWPGALQMALGSTAGLAGLGLVLDATWLSIASGLLAVAALPGAVIVLISTWRSVYGLHESAKPSQVKD